MAYLVVYKEQGKNPSCQHENDKKAHTVPTCFKRASASTNTCPKSCSFRFPTTALAVSIKPIVGNAPASGTKAPHALFERVEETF